MSSNGYQEHSTELSVATSDMHKAIISLQEELEAIDSYNQRADVCKNPEVDTSQRVWASASPDLVHTYFS
jgi:hypothetical protein